MLNIFGEYKNPVHEKLHMFKCHCYLLSLLLYSWDSVSLRMYLVVHSAEEVGVLIGGIGMTVLCALVVIQCRRRSDLIFQPPDFRDTYHVS